MKVHQYKVEIYEGVLDFAHGQSQTQTRLYIPNQGVMGFRSQEKIDFFDDSQEAIAEAEKCIAGKSEMEGGIKYLRQVDLPNKVVAKVVSVGKALNQARTLFNETTKTLVDFLKEAI